MIFLYLAIAALVFGICFAVDKGFTQLFRNTDQHRSGLSVRPSKRYGSFGLVLFVVGLISLLLGLPADWILIVGGIVVMLVGVGLVVYYMTFGVFYDDDTFLLTTFGKRSQVYHYSDIVHQQLYLIQGGNIVIELHLKDKRAVSLQSTMEGTYPFLDHAFAAW